MKERDRLEDLDVDGKVILKWILRKEDEVMSAPRKGQVAGFCEHGAIPSGSVTCLEYRDRLRNSHLPGSYPTD